MLVEHSKGNLFTLQLKSSKKQYIWEFQLNGEPQKIELFDSKLSGKKKVLKNGIVECELVCDESFFRNFTLNGHNCTIIQCGDKNELRIDNQTFDHLYNLERNKQFFSSNPEPTSSFFTAKSNKIEKNQPGITNKNFYQSQQNNNQPKEITDDKTKPIVKENNRNSSKKETDINQSNSTSQIISSPSSLLVSKKILLSTIKHIMRYHKEMNKSNFQSRLPEQNLKYSIESYFSKKYGVKSLVENYVNELYSAIEKFSDEESEVKLFEKILSSRIDENSYDTYNELKDIVDNVLKDYIRDNSSFKPKNELDRVFKLKTKSFISYEEWKYILNIIFNNDYNVIHSQIIQFISDKNSTDEDYNDININYFNNSKMTREQKRTTHFKEKYEIKYTDFICILLDFQIKLRERYLNVISNVFNSYDDDGDGVIEETQFRKMIASFDIEEITEDDVNKLLDVIDPFEYGNVSFNMCVKALSDTMCGNDMSLLDKIINKK